MTCSAIHSTMPSKMPIRCQAVYWPPEKNGVTYAIINPKELRIAHVMMMRFSHARDSVTFRSFFEKFISSRAMDAVTTAAIVEIASTCVCFK